MRKAFETLCASLLCVGRPRKPKLTTVFLATCTRKHGVKAAFEAPTVRPRVLSTRRVSCGKLLFILLLKKGETKHKKCRAIDSCWKNRPFDTFLARFLTMAHVTFSQGAGCADGRPHGSQHAAGPIALLFERILCASNRCPRVCLMARIITCFGAVKKEKPREPASCFGCSRF